MSDELTPEQQFAAEDPSVTVPRDLVRGRAREAIVADLLRLDWSRKGAVAYVEQIDAELRQYHASPKARAALVWEKRRQMVGGVVVTLVGVAFAAMTLLFSVRGGGWVLLPVGVIAVGLLTFGRGYTGWRRYRGERLRL